MPARRSRGQPVDYRALDGGDSDDDFSTATPPTKRPRAKRGSDREAEFADGAGPSGVRASLDDKLFKKQLKIALEKSRAESQTTSAASSETESAADASSQEHSIKSADTLPVSQIDEIESLKKAHSASQNVSSQDADEDEDEWAAAAGAGSGSDESDDSGDDSSFSEDEFKSKAKKPAAKAAKQKKTTATKAATPRGKTGAAASGSSPAVCKRAPAARRSWSSAPEAASPASRPAAAAPNRPVLKALNSGTLSASPALSSPATNARSGTTKWKPPARVSEAAVTEKRLLSPSAGGLRLGLSRNVRLKPLHPSARPVT